MVDKKFFNRSQAIRDFYKSNPKAKTAEVVDGTREKRTSR